MTSAFIACGERPPVSSDETEFAEAIDALARNQNEIAYDSFSRLANRGHLEAQFRTAWMHFRTHGIARADVLSHMWFNIAGKRGHAIAASLKIAIEIDMTPKQIEEAEKLAKEWLDAHPEQATT